MAQALPVPTEEVAAALVLLRTELGLNEADPLIGLRQIAQLAGVAPNTPTIWRVRSRAEYTGPGKMRRPFPQPDDTRYPDKPQWHAISTVLPWLWTEGKLPRGSVGRPWTRGARPAA